MGGGLRPPRRARPREPHHPHLHQHPPPRRAPLDASDQAPRRRTGHLPPRQPLPRAAPRRRGTAQGGEPARPRGHRLAGAGHRHRRHRSRLPDRLDARHRHPAPARGPVGAHAGRDLQGTPLSHHPRRPHGMHRAAPRGPPGQARPAHRPREAPRRAGAADRGRGGDRRVGRDGRLRSRPPRLPLPRPDSRGVRRRGEDARRGLLHPHGTRRRAHPLRRREPAHPRAEGVAARRGDLRRRDPGERRLQRATPTAGSHGWHGQRRLRHREHARRHLPAWHLGVAHPQGLAGQGARRGRPRPAADDSLLARRGPGAHRRAFRRGLRPARRDRPAARRRSSRPTSSVSKTLRPGSPPRPASKTRPPSRPSSTSPRPRPPSA